MAAWQDGSMAGWVGAGMSQQARLTHAFYITRLCSVIDAFKFKTPESLSRGPSPFPTSPTLSGNDLFPRRRPAP